MKFQRGLRCCPVKKYQMKNYNT